MPIDQESFNKKLYDLLKTKGYHPVPKDVKNQRTESPQEADVFNFTFTKQGQDIADAWVTIDDAQDVIVYYDDDVLDSGGRSEGSEFDDSWTGFIQHLKRWAMNKQLGFELRDKNKLGDDMAQRQYTKKKEQISEGYYPMGKQSSYSDNIPTVKIVLQHTRQIQEGEQRYRNIARIYLENQQGERILAPTVRPGIAQVYARHLAEGGLPNDERWNHIKSLCEDYQKMAGFVRATRNGTFNESAMALVTEGVNHYQSLRETLSKMRSNRGYHKYFESYTPTLMETENDTSNLNELFVQEKLDPRIESVLPILSKLHKKIDEMKEVVELDEWAGTVLELHEKPKMSKEKFQEISKKIQDIQMNPRTSTDPALKAQLAKAKAMLRKKAEEAGFEVAKEGLEEGMNNSEEYADQIIDSIGYEGISGNIDGNKIYRAVEEYQKMMDNPEDLDVDEVVEIIVDRLDIRHLGEDLGPEQKRVGQLGPTEKVKNNNIGKLVGASESVENPTMNEDSDEARELELFATNDSDLYRQSYLPIVKNLEKKFKKGIYDKELAKKLWVLHAARAAKKYGQEHGNDDGLKIFSTAVRREVADKLAQEHFAEMEAGNFHDIVKEGKEPLFVAISLDKREEFEDWMDSEGFNVPEPKQKGNYFVYDYTNSDPLEQSYAEEWNEAVDAEDYEFGDEEFGDDEDDDLPFTGGKPAKGTIVDKSGAKHSPMSRARDLAQKGKDSVKEEGITEMDKSQPSSDRGGESSGNPYAKGGKATPVKAKDTAKDAEKELEKSYKKDVKEGQEDLDRILKLSGK